MKAIVVFFVAFQWQQLLAKEITLINECNEPVFVATAVISGGGSDGLNDGGSWVKTTSTGWFRVGPLQREQVDGDYIRVEKKGIALTKTVFNKSDRDGGAFCINQEDAFNFEAFTRDNTAARRAAVHPLIHCIKEGNKWKLFQKIDENWDRFTINQNSCGNTAPASTRVRMRYKRDPSVSMTTFYRVGPSSNEWLSVTEANNFENALLHETDFADDYINLTDKGGNTFGLSENRFSVVYAGTNQWVQVGSGKWMSE